MDEIGLDEVKRRAISGIVALTSRTFILQAISFLTTFLLTIFLDPAVFGVFFVVSAVISFLGYFSDIGLAAALIQKKEAITEDDLKTTFTIQQTLVGIVVISALFFSRSLSSFYNLNSAGLWLFRALIISFFLSSLKTIPSVLLERRLDFNRLIIPQILETVLFGFVAVFLAIKGFGTASFTWAVLARGASGLIAIYILSPWKIRLGFSKEVAGKLLSFGLPFQMNSILALIKDDLFTIFLGKILPFAQIGYVGWAKKWAEFPLRLIMDNVIKVTFPAYSRLQNSPDHLSKALEKSIFFLAFLILPISIFLIFLIKPIVFLIPRYGKWDPALFSFYLFVISGIFASLSTPLTNVLNAIGKIKITLWLMVMWTLLTWMIAPLLVLRIGFNGVAISSVIIGATVFVPVMLTKKFIRFDLFPQIISSLLAASGLSIFLYFLAPYARNFLLLSLILVAGGIIYLGIIFTLSKGRILEEARILWQNFRS